MKKHLDDLNVIDNFMFNELLMQEDSGKAEEFCRSLLEPIIQTKIEHIKIEVQAQKIIQGMDVDKRGVRKIFLVKSLLIC